MKEFSLDWKREIVLSNYPNRFNHIKIHKLMHVINIYINIRIEARCGNTAASVYYGVVCCVRVH